MSWQVFCCSRLDTRGHLGRDGSKHEMLITQSSQALAHIAKTRVFFHLWQAKHYYILQCPFVMKKSMEKQRKCMRVIYKS